MANSKKSGVPRGTRNPIEYLCQNGWTVPALAQEWGYQYPDGVYRLRRYEVVPSNETAILMAPTFGWTAGEVIDHWLGRVERQKRVAAR